MRRTTASLVCYRADLAELESLLQSLQLDPSITAWVVVDNSAAESPDHGMAVRRLVQHHGGMFIAPLRNLGFGAAHNAALQELAGFPSDFHLILNPDICFGPQVLDTLQQAMDARPEAVLFMPRVLYPDQSQQHLCKLLPTPADIILRRFAPRLLNNLTHGRTERYELRDIDHTQPMEVPFLSGCFMFTRRSAVKAVGGFDDRYFLYMEDLDLCRRLSGLGKLLYWPSVYVTHVHARGSHKHLRLTMIHIKSAIAYFNKWGWFLDKERSRVNRAAQARVSVIK